MDDILRFPSAVKHDPALDAWLRAQRDDLRPLVQTWFVRMRQCGGDVRELMHLGRGESRCLYGYRDDDALPHRALAPSGSRM